MKKRIINILTLGLIANLFFSCVDLAEDSRSSLSTGNFYKTESDAVAAVQSVYNGLTHNTSGDHASIYNRLFVLAVGMMTDDHIPGPRATNPDVRSIGALTQTSTNTRYYELWRQHYETINRANAAIDRLPAIDPSNETISRLVLEAKFLRALLYYNLVRLWGDVPLILQETTSLKDLQVARTPKEEVYAQITKDFTEALQLPTRYSGTDGFRATSGAARAFLLSIAITRQDWQEAIKQYQAIESGEFGYDLFPDFKDNFDTSKENTGEHIFDAYTIADGSNTNILSYIAAPVTGFEPGQGTGADADAPIVTLRARFSDDDIRRGVTLKDSILVSNSGTQKTYNPHFYKYWDDASATNLSNNGVNIPIIRYAEVVLFYAEAQNELNGPNTEAYHAINRIRNRAGLSDLTPGLSKAQFREAIFHERQLEFVYEQIRWFDLIRTNGSGAPLLTQALKDLIDPAKGGNPTDTWCVSKANNVSDKFLLLPIPASEIIANGKLTQNPGWE